MATSRTHLSSCQSFSSFPHALSLHVVVVIVVVVIVVVVVVVVPALSIASPFESIYLGLHNYNCALTCFVIGDMFYALTWQTHLLSLACDNLAIYKIPLCKVTYAEANWIYYLRMKRRASKSMREEQKEKEQKISGNSELRFFLSSS
ncbi:urea transporter 2-like [Limosa lapponica baueri]|uniref:Urea transporter 2-like n=1 Tax=Limosa lapponica baueri TaxID=1758121 RepID=A0A2I0T930_LIMLA|nr:urea transporter 2-like [Limosa lapponica baueri]